MKIFKNDFSQEKYQELLGQLKSNEIIKDFGDHYSIEEVPAKTQAEELESLRARREAECFPVINRGQFWYDSLSLDQRQELLIWYNAWLNVTDTKVVPTAPVWLKINPSKECNSTEQYGYEQCPTNMGQNGCSEQSSDENNTSWL